MLYEVITTLIAGALKSRIRQIFPIGDSIEGDMAITAKRDGYYIINIGKNVGVDVMNAFLAFDPLADGSDEFLKEKGTLVVMEVGQTSSRCQLIKGKADVDDQLKEDSTYHDRSMGFYATLDISNSAQPKGITIGYNNNCLASPIIWDINLGCSIFRSPFTLTASGRNNFV